ncbi:DedA family protein [Marinomonas spartinae]|uniref:DedA family protein n=1 Tax=Marinomonas spartinae TaxID=1792290 RepID=UPI0018F14D26|nr:DedA family protein [Marinomonas spartinae]MBJ7554044.1 DedA family protein [Marinomonas spartinae]
MIKELSLALGTFADSFIGINIFVPGEPFYLAAGYQLYHQNVFAVFMALLGGWLGDQLSYWVGFRYGQRAQRFLCRLRPKLRRKVALCRVVMDKKGNWAILFARVLGPVAWFMPFLAGNMRVSWWRFTVLSTTGLLLGGGQFIVLGYILSAQLIHSSWFSALDVFHH